MLRGGPSPAPEQTPQGSSGDGAILSLARWQEVGLSPWKAVVLCAWGLLALCPPEGQRAQSAAFPDGREGRTKHRCQHS